MCQREEASGVQFLDLPELVLQNIVRNYLSPKSIAALSATCKLCNLVCSQESVWRTRCSNDCSIDLKDPAPFSSFKELYTKLLYSYGWLFGLWYMDIFPYGGLINFKLQDGGIIGESFVVPSTAQAANPLTRTTILRISEDVTSSSVKVQCCIAKPQQTLVHKAEIKHGIKQDLMYATEKRDFLGEGFTLACNQKGHHNDMIQQGLSFWGRLVSGGGTEVRNACFRRIHISRSLDSRKQVRQGVFKGDYGGHGIELIYVHEINGKLNGFKVTGDPNIPAGKITFRVTDSTPRTLKDALREHEMDSDLFGVVDGHRFQCPLGYLSRDTKPPDFYRECYVGSGQVAHTGYRSPQWIPAIIVTFDENTIGVLWLMLQSLSIYLRVSDDNLE